MDNRLTRALASPLGWIAFQILEILVLGFLIHAFVPQGWSRGLRVSVVLPTLLAVVLVNYRIRRRWLPPAWDAGPGSARGPQSGAR